MATGLVAGSEDHNRGFRRILYLLIWLVIVPTALLLIVSILMLWKGQTHVLFPILVMALVVCLVTGGVLSMVFLRREANLSKLQLDFVSKVSHELRTPLTSIRMFVEMLQSSEGRDPAETALCLQVLQKETIRLSERIERLLDWGRMEAGRRVYDHKLEQPDDVVHSALAEFEATRVGRSQAITLEVEEGLPAVNVDIAALGDALVNLLSNAVKYSGEDPQITLRVSADLRHVRFEVCDKGIGIPRREHNRIFQKFYRADDRLSREVEGSGLGLAIVRHIAQGHNGKVELVSEPGVGSTFGIVVPRAIEAEAAKEHPTDQIASAT